MKKVWKYPFIPRDVLQVDMPIGAQALCVQLQDGRPCLWALVESEAPVGTRTFRVVGTGHPAEGLGSYIGTFQFPEMQLVFHVFEANA